MRVMKLIGLALVVVMSVVAISTLAVAQEAAQTAPTVKHVPMSNIPSNSRKEMFNSYCAICHGNNGKGDGPAA